MTIKSLAVFSILAGFSQAVAAGQTMPAAVPVDQIPVPPPRAVTALAVPATQPSVPTISGKILILPFEAIGEVQNHAWVARSVQQSLNAEIARLGGLMPISMTVANPSDTGVAHDIGANQGAEMVIFGSVQFAGTQVRLTGEIMNVSTGKAVAGLKASGDFKDLFSLEDEISSQMDRALKPPPAVASVPPANNSMIFEAVAPTPADLFPAPTDQDRFANQYQQYYTAPAPYIPYLYGGYGSPIGAYFHGYGGFGGGYGAIVVIHGGGGGHGGHGHADAEMPTAPIMPAPPGGGMPAGPTPRSSPLAAASF
jgi:TolB-like protein